MTREKHHSAGCVDEMLPVKIIDVVGDSKAVKSAVRPLVQVYY